MVRLNYSFENGFLKGKLEWVSDDCSVKEIKVLLEAIDAKNNLKISKEIAKATREKRIIDFNEKVLPSVDKTRVGVIHFGSVLFDIVKFRNFLTISGDKRMILGNNRVRIKVIANKLFRSINIIEKELEIKISKKKSLLVI